MKNGDYSRNGNLQITDARFAKEKTLWNLPHTIVSDKFIGKINYLF